MLRWQVCGDSVVVAPHTQLPLLNPHKAVSTVWAQPFAPTVKAMEGGGQHSQYMLKEHTKLWNLRGRTIQWDCLQWLGTLSPLTCSFVTSGQTRSCCLGVSSALWHGDLQSIHEGHSAELSCLQWLSKRPVYKARSQTFIHLCITVRWMPHLLYCKSLILCGWYFYLGQCLVLSVFVTFTVILNILFPDLLFLNRCFPNSSWLVPLSDYLSADVMMN